MANTYNNPEIYAAANSIIKKLYGENAGFRDDAPQNLFL